MKRAILNGLLLLFTGLVMVCAIWGPEALARYKDNGILNTIKTQEAEMEGEGYRYQLSSREKLYILSRCFNAQSWPESEQSALTRDQGGEVEYRELEGTYAFVVNHRGPSGQEITEEEIFTTCDRELAKLKELQVIPKEVQETKEGSYEAVLYSAIDVLEPRNNVSVWKVSLANTRKSADKSNRLIDAYLDGNSGKIYEFYVRTRTNSWEKIDPDLMAEKWGQYMELGEPEPYEVDNPFMEATPYYKKYVFSAGGEERTIVTIGFYEGINELFLKVSR